MSIPNKIEAVVFDFDGTVADTFAPGPRGIGVEEAYAYAFGEIFGQEGAQWFAQYGLDNRAPREIIAAFLESHGPCAVVFAHEYFFREVYEHADDVVPCGKGVPLIWDAADPTAVIAEILVRVKLRCLERQICRTWPQPCGDVQEYQAHLAASSIPYALLSSGHERFITKTFNAWGMEAPPMLTDDDLRGRPGDHSAWVKPNGNLFGLLREQWAKTDARIAAIATGSFLYLGDDPVKDGELATNVGAQFALYDPTGQKRSHVPSMRAFTRYRELIEM